MRRHGMAVAFGVAVAIHAAVLLALRGVLHVPVTGTRAVQVTEAPVFEAVAVAVTDPTATAGPVWAGPGGPAARPVKTSKTTDVAPAPEPAMAVAAPAGEAGRGESTTEMQAGTGTGTGIEAGSPTQVGSGSGSGAGTRAGSVTDLLQRIRAVRRYPELARRREIEGVVRLRFRVLPDGRPVELAIVRSADPLLDAAAREAVERAAPLPAIPGALEVDLEFQLTEP